MRVEAMREGAPGHVPASASQALCTGIPDLDALRPFVPGRPALLTGPRSLLSEFEHRLVLSALASGGEVFVACGDNRLDAFRLLALARRRGLEREACDGVRLARAFTVHQWTAILEETLPRAAELPCTLVIAAGFLDLYHDEDVRPEEGRALLLRGASALSRLTHATVVATSIRRGSFRVFGASARRGSLLSVAECAFPELVDIEPASDLGLSIHLPKRGARLHVSRPGITTLRDFGMEERMDGGAERDLWGITARPQNPIRDAGPVPAGPLSGAT